MTNYSAERERMVRQQLSSRGIKDARVLSAMARVPRHLFVTEELRGQAYEDYPLPIGEGQTISQPYMVALMAEALRLRGQERILEVGTGSGYEAAVLAELCAHVYSVERVEDLAIQARAILRSLGYHNVSIRVGDGTLGWAEEAPFDSVIVSAAAPGLPRPLLDQVQPGGCLVVPMGEEELQTLVRIHKGENGGYREDYLGECRFVKLMGLHGWEN